MTIALLTLTHFLMATQTEVKFQRTFVANESTAYHFEMEMSESAGVKADIQTTVKEVTSTGAMINFKATNVEMKGLGSASSISDMTSRVDSFGMPTEANIEGDQVFYVFLSLMGATPGTASKLGDSVPIHWQNQAKTITFDGKGKLVEADEKAKTMTVAWNITMTSADHVEAAFVVKSVYSSRDFSLNSSEGTLTQGEFKVKLSAKRKSSG